MTWRVLITGGLGYVGGRIARFLEETGRYELVLGTRRPGVSRVVYAPRAEVVSMDLLTDDLSPLCAGVEAIIHLAAVNEVESAKSPARALRVNGEGTLRLLIAAKQAGVKRFLYFSTAHVYGAPLAGRISETSLPKPVHPYAITHRVAEDFVLAEQSAGSMEGIVVRLSNGFGEPAHGDVDRWTLLVNDLCRQAVTAQALILRSSGTQLRDFITLHDVARGAEHLLRLPRLSLGDGLFNLGGDMVMSVYDMTLLIADRCETLFGFRPSIQRPTPPTGETTTPLIYGIDKLRQTGFEPAGDIIAEIDNTLRFCRAAFAGAGRT
jgi:UDP-glucose 4-epimerase